MGSSVTLGAAAGLFGGPALVNMGYSWQKMSLYLSIFAWVGVVFTLILMASRPQAPAGDGAAPGETDKGLFRRALFAPLTFLGIATSFMVMWVFHSTLGVVPGALSFPRPLGAGYSALQSGSLMQGVTIAGIVGPVLGGYLMDKVFKGNPKANMLLGFASMFIFVGLMLLPAVLYNPALLIVCLAMAGLGFQFIVPILFVYVGKMYPLPIVGQMVGLWIGIGTFGGVVGQAIGPAVAQAKGTYLWAYGLMSLAAFLGFFLSIFMTKQKPVTVAAQVTA
jgi:MFS family permease